MNESIHLLACTSCNRQLDVSALSLGDSVRCVCDHVLTVGPPKIVTVRGLCCGHCGGIVQEGATSCGFCRAELHKNDLHESRLCPACASRIPLDSRHCKACGVELRGAAIPPLPKDGTCPRCDGSLCIHLIPGAELIECASGCGGLWCTRETFERLSHKARTSSIHMTPGTVPLLTPGGFAPESESPNPEAQRQYIPCMTCGSLMQRRQFRHAGRPSGVVLDVCKNHGVWFDSGELTSALAFVASMSVRQHGLGHSTAGTTPIPPPPASTAGADGLGPTGREPDTGGTSVKPYVPSKADGTVGGAAYGALEALVVAICDVLFS